MLLAGKACRYFNAIEIDLFNLLGSTFKDYFNANDAENIIIERDI